LSNTLSLRYSYNVRDQVSHSYRVACKITVLYIYTYYRRKITDLHNNFSRPTSVFRQLCCRSVEHEEQHPPPS
jgi:uncharacterized Fe-S cluster-containing radical SAM superfamily protein